MTEREWLTDHHPSGLIQILTLGEGIHASLRKKRLYCLACSRPLATHNPDWSRGALIEPLERAAEDGKAWIEFRSSLKDDSERDFLMPGSVVGYYEATGAYQCHEDELLREICSSTPDLARVGVVSIVGRKTYEPAPRFFCRGREEERLISNQFEDDLQNQCELLRDIFGNPFRPVFFDSEWRTSSVVSLAKSMYDSRDFSLMPIFGDALQDAGCEHSDILAHCRGGGPHVRGCWVIDQVLDKD
jgi:hypothetical protein